MRPLRLCARFKRIRRHGKCKEQQEKSCHSCLLPLPSPAYLPLSLCLCFPFAVVGNCFRFPVEWKFAKLTNDCNCVCSSMRVCECVCAPVRLCVTENALYTLGNVRKFNNILIRLHFKGVAPKIFLCLPATP